MRIENNDTRHRLEGLRFYHEKISLASGGALSVETSSF